jgi:hypothetical protein
MLEKKKDELTPLMHLVLQIRDAAYDKCWKNHHKEIGYRNHEALDEKLQKVLENDFNLIDLNINLRVETTFIKSYINQKKEVNFNKVNAPLSNFIILCSYLANKKNISDWAGKESFISLLNEVSNIKDNKIKPETLETVISLWSADGPIFSHFYYFHFSLGDEEPDVALLKIDEQFKKAKLKFITHEDHSDFTGDITNAAKDKTIFITLKEDKLSYGAFLSMMPAENISHKVVSRFDGYYCSALSRDNGKPVAGKFIAIKTTKDDLENTGQREKSAEEYRPLLYNQRLKYKNDSLRLDQFKPYVDDWEGYWFRMKQNKPTIIKIGFRINADGTVRFNEYSMKRKPQGYIHHIHNEYLRCSFEYEDDHNYRLLMIFDLQQENKNVLDGVYCGQKDGWGKIITGRIRLYRSTDKTKTFETIKSRAIPFDEASDIIGEKAEDLKKFFFGESENEESNNFIQPNLASFKAYVNPTTALNSKEFTKNYAGLYSMFKMDSDRTRINCYSLKIERDGVFTYAMQQEQSITNYSGVAHYAEFNCLVLQVDTKNDRPHFATYIFWVGTNIRAEINTLTGVYSAISDSSPVCGQAVLAKRFISDITKPYYKGSDEYWQSNEQTYEILKYLSIIENNLIKTPRDINSLGRNIKYGNVFFSFACSEKTGDRLFYFHLALENGFDDVGRIEEECNNGKLMNLEVELVKDGGLLKVKFEIRNKTYQYKLLLKNR